MSDAVQTLVEREHAFGVRRDLATDPDVLQLWRTSAPLFAAGGAAIVAGGVAAAVTGPTGWDHGSWVTAFLVLVTGVAQIGLGAGQAHLAASTPNARVAVAVCASWNTGGLAVVAGTILSTPFAVTVGSGLLVTALALSMVAVRGGGGQPLLLVLYRLLLGVLLVSIPIGNALAWARR